MRAGVHPRAQRGARAAFALGRHKRESRTAGRLAHDARCHLDVVKRLRALSRVDNVVCEAVL